MELVAITDSYDVDDLPIPAEYVFRLESGEEWVLCFVPTVPYNGESAEEELFGDLFPCPARSIVAGTRPIARGGLCERQMLDRLAGWVASTRPTTDQDVADHADLSWFLGAMERRRNRVEAD